MTTYIIDYDSGNLHSAAKAFERMAIDTGETIRITSDSKDIQHADRVVLPGVGAFGDCYQALASRPGMIDALNEAVMEKHTPFFGICVGMQLLADKGLEHGDHPGLGWISGQVVPLSNTNRSLRAQQRESALSSTSLQRQEALQEVTLKNASMRSADRVSLEHAPSRGQEAERVSKIKIPHMGWNTLTLKQSHPILEHISEGDHAYFVHSYHFEVNDPGCVIATTDYGQTINAIIAHNNIIATQFHPEKSQRTGLQIIKNFLNL